jgi:hypothetical protein
MKAGEGVACTEINARQDKWLLGGQRQIVEKRRRAATSL